MLELIERSAASESSRQGVTTTLTLPFEQRQKSRFRARLDAPSAALGVEVFVLLERGLILRDGDILRAVDGTRVRVVAAPEGLSVAKSREPLALLRAAYHLGNRHVRLQIDGERLAYQHDHVLDTMVRSLGLEVAYEEGPFDPEAGAYGAHGNGHGHGHGPGHDHDHEHHHHIHEHTGHRHEH